jgi:ribulose-phosphate 3-epimerase
MDGIWSGRCIYAPSLICLDMCNLERQTSELAASGVEVLHVDILDGHFSPSMPLGLETVRQLRGRTDMAFDVHLMTATTDYFLDELLDIGVQQIALHAETTPHLDGALSAIRARGVRAGVALKPSTPLQALDYVLEKCDVVLLMLINPGYASSAAERQIPYADRKITELRAMIDSRGAGTLISIDGRVSAENIERYGGGTVDIFVTGSTCLDKNRLGESMSELNALRDGLVRQGREGGDV